MLRNVDITVKRTVALAAGIAVLGSGVWVSEFLVHKEKEIVFTTEQEMSWEADKERVNDREEITVAVHVTGAVNDPGVYHLPEDSRVDDAVKKAGPQKDADLQMLNLAAPLRDGQKVHIPVEGEMEANEQQSKMVNVNTADRDRLATLPGVGPVTAEKIYKHRQLQGPFVEMEDLMEVDGIGPATLDNLRDRVTLY